MRMVVARAWTTTPKLRPNAIVENLRYENVPLSSQHFASRINESPLRTQMKHCTWQIVHQLTPLTQAIRAALQRRTVTSTPVTIED